MNRITIWIVLIITMFGCNTSQQIQSVTKQSSLLENHLIPLIHDETNPVYFNIDDRLNYHNISGLSLAIIENNCVTLSKGYGKCRKESEQSVRTSSIFQVGSISKSITALLILKLRDDGRLALNDDVEDYLKSWSFPEDTYLKQEAITFRMLLNHTSGIKNINSKGIKQKEEIPSLNEFLNNNVEFDTIPGAKYNYSNVGYAILQRLIEDITGSKFSDVAKELIFVPLKMNNSTFETILPKESTIDYCYSYNNEGELNEGYWRNLTRKSSGGLYSNPEDLSKLILEFQNAKNGNSQTFSKESINEILSGAKYNLGFEIDGQNESLSITHTGRTSGFYAYMRFYPNLGKGIIMSSNSDNGGEIFKEILRGYSKLNDLNILKPKIINSVILPKTQLANYLGSYELKVGGERYVIEIKTDNYQLQYNMKGENKRYPLRAIDSRVFLDIVEGEKFEFVKETSGLSKLITNDEYQFRKLK